MALKRKLRKDGGSQVVSLPTSLTDSLGWKRGDTIEIFIAETFDKDSGRPNGLMLRKVEDGTEEVKTPSSKSTSSASN